MRFEDAVNKFLELLENGRPGPEAKALVTAAITAERRERIATAVLGTVFAGGYTYDEAATQAVKLADALIAELDKPRAL